MSSFYLVIIEKLHDERRNVDVTIFIYDSAKFSGIRKQVWSLFACEELDIDFEMEFLSSMSFMEKNDTVFWFY